MTDSAQKTPRTDTLQDELTKRGRDVWLAGLGALATVEEEGSKLFSRLVDRGKAFEDDRRHDLEAASEKAREQRDEALEHIEVATDETRTLITDTVNRALERFGVPTRSEVDRLSDRVEGLSKQVDELTDALSRDVDEPVGNEETV